MDNSGFVNFSGMLDPGAQEFVPPSLFPTPPPVFYSYPYPTPNEPAGLSIQYPAGSFNDPAGLINEPAGLSYSYTNTNTIVNEHYAQVVFPQYVRVDPPPLPVSLPPPSNTPSRALLLSSVPTEVSESTVRRDLEVFGDLRAVEMERVGEGIVAVHFYDIRHAETALVEIQQQHMQQQLRLRQHFEAVLVTQDEAALCRFPAPVPPPAVGLVSGRAVWAQFMFPAGGRYPEAYNQGSLVIFNVDYQVPTCYLKEIFEKFGTLFNSNQVPSIVINVF